MNGGFVMKKLAVLGSGRGDNFEAIAEYFESKDVEITCISDNLNSDIILKAREKGINTKYLPFTETAEYFGVRTFDLIALSDYRQKLSDEILELGRFINIHPALLPAFKGEDAIYRAFHAGVKVSGVTVHQVTSEPDGGKIIAQYPVLIGNTTHFDEFEKEIHSLENILYPRVIETILDDKVFDFTNLFRGHSCGGNCDGCH